MEDYIYIWLKQKILNKEKDNSLYIIKFSFSKLLLVLTENWKNLCKSTLWLYIYEIGLFICTRKKAQEYKVDLWILQRQQAWQNFPCCIYSAES